MFIKKEVPDKYLSLGERFVRNVNRDLDFESYKDNKDKLVEEVKKRL